MSVNKIIILFYLKDKTQLLQDQLDTVLSELEDKSTSLDSYDTEISSFKHQKRQLQ